MGSPQGQPDFPGMESCKIILTKGTPSDAGPTLRAKSRGQGAAGPASLLGLRLRELCLVQGRKGASS